MKIVILTEGGEKIGFGHITRCIPIYDYLIEVSNNIKFYVKGNRLPKWLLGNRIVDYQNWMEIRFLDCVIDKKTICIIDSYNINYELLSLIKTKSFKGILINDSIHKKGELLNLNPTIYSDKFNNMYNKYIAGRKFTMIREEFLGFPAKEIKQTIKSVFITLGGSKQKTKILELVNECFHNYGKDVIMTIVSSDKTYFEDNIKNSINLVILDRLDARQMAEHMFKSDIVISACGQSSNEAIELNIPLVVVKLVKNQEEQYKYLTKNKLALGFSFLQKNYTLKKISNYDVRKEIFLNQSKITFKDGAKNIIQEILK